MGSLSSHGLPSSLRHTGLLVQGKPLKPSLAPVSWFGLGEPARLIFPGWSTHVCPQLWMRVLFLGFLVIYRYGNFLDFAEASSQAACSGALPLVPSSSWSCPTFTEAAGIHLPTAEISSLTRSPVSAVDPESYAAEATADYPAVVALDLYKLPLEQWPIGPVLCSVWPGLDRRCLHTPGTSQSMAERQPELGFSEPETKTFSWTKWPRSAPSASCSWTSWTRATFRERTWKWTWTRAWEREWTQQRSWQTVQREASRTDLDCSTSTCQSPTTSGYNNGSSHTICSRSLSKDLDVDSAQQLRAATCRSTGSDAVCSAARSTSQQSHPSLSSYALDEGTTTTTRGLDSKEHPSQCMEILCRGIRCTLGRLCARFSTRGPNYADCCSNSQGRLATGPDGARSRACSSCSRSCPQYTWDRGCPRDAHGRGGRFESVGPFRHQNQWRLGGDAHILENGPSQIGGSHQRGRGGTTKATPASGCSYSYTKRCCYPASAFWWGRHVGPTGIPCQWPGASSCQPVLTWLHSICHESDFVSPWAACSSASRMAFECGFSLPPSSPISVPPPATVKASAKTVTFAAELDLLIGLQDSPTLTHVSLSVDDFHTWKDKPWTLQCALPHLEGRLLGEVLPPAVPGRVPEDIAGQQYELPDLHDAPGWIQDLWPDFLVSARFHRRDHDPTAYCRTWFIDHHLHPRCEVWREFRLDPFRTNWQSNLLDLWRDHYNPLAPFTIAVVRPPVPPIAGWEAHVADVVVTQSATVGRTTLLCMTRSEVDYLERVSLTALSVPVQQPRHALLMMARLMTVCWQHPCHLIRAGRELHDGILTHSEASGLLIQVDPLPTDAFSLMQRPANVDSTLPPPAGSSDPGACAVTHHAGFVFEDWRRDILRLHDVHSAIAFEDEGPIILIHTWFIHHDDHRSCLEPRAWTVDASVDLWHEDLRTLWQDLLDPGLPFFIHMVYPRPLRLKEDHHVGHLIVTQGPRDYKAVLLSAQYREPQGVHLVQGAFSTLARSDGQYLLRLVGAAHPCIGLPCTLWHHPHRMPLHTRFDVLDGMSFEVTIPIDAMHGDDEISSLMAVPQHRPLGALPLLNDTNIAVDPDAPAEPPDDPEDVPEEPASPHSDASHFDWYSSVLYTRSAAPVAGFLEWTEYSRLHSSAAHLLGLSSHDVRAVHHVHATPTDLARSGTDAFIVELHHDLAPGHGRSLVLVDTGFFYPTPLADPYVVREVRVLPDRITRRQLLVLLGLDVYCDELSTRQGHPECIIWHNAQLVPGQFLGQVELQHGDYLRLALPPALDAPAHIDTIERSVGFAMQVLLCPRFGLPPRWHHVFGPCFPCSLTLMSWMKLTIWISCSGMFMDLGPLDALKIRPILSAMRPLYLIGFTPSTNYG